MKNSIEPVVVEDGDSNLNQHRMKAGWEKNIN